ncbi:MAG: UTP--glucose-1-phosphate uridylyltransferase [Acidobacteria bacterium]|nr:UTP--glucose-1-phosphate uridylyltransferase [Acidobacteriota bacterium]MBI3658030.1 UTP--glucose-1-phosphate uridylyltransferase [Acidobacteriota bacterium]
MAIKNAIVPVAGLGTRLLPATKSQPKEMLPVGKKPVVQYVVEELENCGIERILFVTGRNKTSIENHFDVDHELMRLLRETGREELIDELKYEQMAVHFLYTRQRRPRGLGDAILYGESFAGREPFVVALGDSILGLHAQSHVVRGMGEVYEQRRAVCVIAVEEVPVDMVSAYGVVKPQSGDDVFVVEDLIEKPSPAEAPSRLAIAARYVFSPRIFEALRETPPDRRGEVQLTDAIRRLIRQGEQVIGVRLRAAESRYDIGSFESYFNAFMEFALTDPEHGAKLRQRLERWLHETH